MIKVIARVGLKSLDVSPCNELLLSPMIIKNSLSHISRHLEFITEQGHRVNWVSGSLDSRLTGSLVAYLSIGLALFPFPLDFQLPSAVPFLPSL